MYIEECYIRDFGVVHDFLYRADRHMNAILLPNGSGKTTFAEFLKVMFYGMPSTGNKKNIDDTPRVKYMPWNGMSMGGYIIFSASGRRYKLERKFMRKEKEDFFRLIDMETGLESLEYSAQIGEELFGVDEDSFVSAAYISQRDRRYLNGEKVVSQLAFSDEGDEDLINFNIAQKKLDDAYRFFVRTGNRGEIARLNSEITKSRIKKDKLESALMEEDEFIYNENSKKPGAGVVLILISLIGMSIGMFVMSYVTPGMISSGVTALFALISFVGRRKNRTRSPKYMELLQLQNDEEEAIRKLEEEINQAEYDAEIIRKANELLNKARKNCIDSYYESIREGFLKYAGKFDGKLLELSNLKVEEEAFYSDGIRDVFSFCRKLACNELVFNGGEVPFMVLDDPFVEMDDDTISKAIDIVSEISERQQVFYFTCQSGRMP